MAQGNCIVRGAVSDTESAIRLFDAGAVKVVVEPEISKEALGQLPKERILLALTVSDVSSTAFSSTSVVPKCISQAALVDWVQKLGALVGGFVLVYPERSLPDLDVLLEARKHLKEEADLWVSCEISSIEQIPKFDQAKVDVLVFS